MVNIELYKKKKKELGLTFEALYELSGVPVQTLHNVFRGSTQTPRIDTIVAIEKALGIDNAQSYSQQGEFNGTSTHSLSDNEKTLLSAFNSLIPPLQEYALQMVVGLTKQAQNLKNKNA